MKYSVVIEIIMGVTEVANLLFNICKGDKQRLGRAWEL
jgi:hypothetical protein